MTEILLPQINFDSNPGYNEWSFLHKIYSQEFYTRLLIGSTPGIVDNTKTNPTVGPFTTGRPLNVSVNAANTQTLDITKGYAVTPNYQVIILDANLTSVPLPSVIANTVYIVCIEYKLVASAETRLNRFGTSVEVRNERPSTTPYGGADSTLSQAVTVVTLTDYSNASLFTPDRLANLVVIAVVSVLENATTGNLSLAIDQTQTTFLFNRPWFSFRDEAHRSYLGSGVFTENNPHALSIQDLSSSGFTLYQQLSSKGGVYSKDFSSYGYPGTFCTELISLSRIEIDKTGEITQDAELSQLGGRYYVKLAKVPTRMGSLYFSGTPWKPVPYYWKPGTRYLILAPLEKPLNYGSSLVVEYFAVSALMPPAEDLNQGVQSFTVTQPASGVDFIVTGGQSLDALTSDTLNLSALLGPIKKAYNVLCTTNGTLVTSPQNLVPVLKVTDLLQQTTIDINQSPLNGVAVSWSIGLTRAPNSNLNLNLIINGIDTNGGIVEDIISFTASQYMDQSATDLVEQPLQFRVTKYKYTKINSIRITNTTDVPDNSGDEAILSLWANLSEAPEIQELANVASFFWDGLGARRITDARSIGTSIQNTDQREPRLSQLVPETDASLVQEMFNVLMDPPLTTPSNQVKRLALEIDQDREFGETWNKFSSTDATGTIQCVDFSYVTEGMTIRLAEKKVLTFVSTTANANIGEVQIPVSSVTGNTEIRNNIAATVNNGTWDSSWKATAGDTNVSLTRPEAFPDGFTVCYRQKLVFNQDFTTALATITFTIAGVSIGTVTAQGTHGGSMDAIVTAVNAITSQTGVTAVRVSSTRDYVMLNGNVIGEKFIVTLPQFSGAVLTTAVFSSPLEAFTITSPTNGYLPTPHLPNRFLSAEKKWTYVSRAIPWVNLSLKAVLGFNAVADIKNADQLQIATNKIIVARVSPTTTLGEFLVDPTSLLNTLKNIRDAINNPLWDSGCHAEIHPSNTKLLITIGGYATAQLILLKESVASTWLLVDYTACGVDSVFNVVTSKWETKSTRGSTGYVKALYPLETAEWRYQVIKPAELVSTFIPADVILPDTVDSAISITNHGLVNGDPVYFQTTATLPSPLVVNQVYYVVSATSLQFKVSKTKGGDAIKLITTGTGTHSIYVNQPYGPNDWSPYYPMSQLSPTAYKLNGPTASSLYCVQLRLIGADSRANAFSLYQMTPEVANTTLAALATRLSALDDPTTGEVVVARGTTANLNARLSQVINPDGTPIQNVDLEDAKLSTIQPEVTSLKERLDVSDGLTYWLTGTADNYLKPTALGNLAIPDQIVSGPADTLGNSQFLYANANPKIVSVAGTSSDPLIVALNGNYYSFARSLDVDFTNLPSSATPYYIHCQIRNIAINFVPADITVNTERFNLSYSGLLVGDHVKFSTTDTLPAPLVAGTVYYVNGVDVAGFSVSTLPNGSSIDITDTGAGTHTITLVDQELGQIVLSGKTTQAISAGSSTIKSNTSLQPLINTMLASKIPLVLWMSSVNTATGRSFFSPIATVVDNNTMTIVGDVPDIIPVNTYFEIRSYRECYFTARTTQVRSRTSLPIGQCIWNGTSVSDIRNYRYQDNYISEIKGPYSASTGTYGTVTFDHNLGKIPSNFKLYYHSTSTGDSSPTLIENDALFSVSTTKILVTNRYANVIVKTFSGTNIQNNAYLQLVI